MMLKNSKNLLDILFAIAFALLIVACGGETSEKTSDNTPEDSSRNINKNSEELNSNTKSIDSPIAGNWQVKGTQPAGDPYSGTLEVEAINEKLYTMEWNLTSGMYHGTGLYDKSKERMFAAYGIKTKRYGLFIYTIENSVLADEGVWISGYGTGSETILEKPANGITGSYKVKGKRPKEYKGFPPTYEGTLTIEKSKKSTNVYKVNWDLGDGEPYNGIAFLSKDGTRLVGAWGIGGDYGAVIYNFEGTKKGVGSWAKPSDVGFGKEVITH